MSTEIDLIVAALADGPLKRGPLIEATGLDEKVISNRLFAAKQKGLVLKTADGWALPEGAAPKPRVHAASEETQTQPKPRSKVAKKHKTATPRVAPSSPPPKPKRINGAATREYTFAIGEDGSILFKVIAGPRSGELGSISQPDAMALYRLMESVDWIRENA